MHIKGSSLFSNFTAPPRLVLSMEPGKENIDKVKKQTTSEYLNGRLGSLQALCNTSFVIQILYSYDPTDTLIYRDHDDHVMRCCNLLGVPFSELQKSVYNDSEKWRNIYINYTHLTGGEIPHVRCLCLTIDPVTRELIKNFDSEGEFEGCQRVVWVLEYETMSSMELSQAWDEYKTILTLVAQKIAEANPEDSREVRGCAFVLFR